MDALDELRDALPSHSIIRFQTPDVQKTIFMGFMADKTVIEIRNELAAQGVKITLQQLHRARRHVMPVLSYKAEPGFLFQDKKTKELLNKLETLLDATYKRIREAINDELEEKEHLVPHRLVESTSVSWLAAMLKEYYAGTIDDVDKGVLLSIMERKPRDTKLYGEIQSFMKMVNEYLMLRKSLGDTTINLDPETKEEKVIELHGDKTEEVRSELRKKLAALKKD